MPTGLLFKTPRGADADKALAFCSRGLAGAEMYTFLKLNGASLPEGCFWCAESGGEVTAAVFNNGDRTINDRPGEDPYPDACVGVYAAAPPETIGPLELTRRDLFDAYLHLNGGGTISNANAERYVYRARAMREGLAAGWGIKKDGKLISFAFISAQNEDHALLADVFTAPEWRGRGYASRCVLAAVRAALSAGKTPFLLCAPRMKRFYTRLGFVFDESGTGGPTPAEDE